MKYIIGFFSLAILLTGTEAIPIDDRSDLNARFIPATNTWASPIPPSLSAVATPTGAFPPIKSGNPFMFPLPNGFPNLSPATLNATSIQAHGTEPNGPPPTNLNSDDLTSLRLLALNELFEIAFFTDLLFNITNDVVNFTIEDQNLRQFILNALIAIQAQEELHADTINKVLMANGQQAIKPCTFKFPTTTLTDALALAKTFTDLVLGTFQDIQLLLGQNNDNALIPVLSSVLGQEGEQVGFFRTFAGLVPSELPFLTRATREFAFSALNQMFIVPGSCPNENLIALPIFLPLTVSPSPTLPQDQTLSFTFPNNGAYDTDKLSIVYINSQNLPIVQKINKPTKNGGVLSFEAFFPYNEYLLNGLTIAAVTNTSGPFTSAEDVAKVTVAGPGLIEIL